MYGGSVYQLDEVQDWWTFCGLGCERIVTITIARSPIRNSQNTQIIQKMYKKS